MEEERLSGRAQGVSVVWKALEGPAPKQENAQNELSKSFLSQVSYLNKRLWWMCGICKMVRHGDD